MEKRDHEEKEGKVGQKEDRKTERETGRKKKERKKEEKNERECDIKRVGWKDSTKARMMLPL